MPIEIRLILAVFACYRMTGLLVYDEGPLSIFIRIRVWLGAYDIIDGTTRPRTSWGRLITCPHCISVWVALAACILVLFPGIVGDAILILGGIAGAVSFLYMWPNRN